MTQPRTRIVVNKDLKPICPIDCGYQECAPSHSFGPAIRSYYLLHFVVSGKGIFETAGEKLTLSENDAFIIRPYEITYYEADARDPWTYIWIAFTSDIPLPSAIMTKNKIHAPYLRSLFVDAFFTGAFDERDSSEAYDKYLCGAVWQMCGMLERDTSEGKSLTPDHVKQAIAIIEYEYHTELTASSIAGRLHLNRTHFSEIFKVATGVPPSRYIRDIRMKKAAELLIKRKLSVTVTAVSVGYPDVFAFSRAFKSFYGVSPTEYVRLKLNN